MYYLICFGFFDYITAGLFGGPLNADFLDNFSGHGYFEF